MPALRGPDGKVIYVRDDEVSRYTAGGEYAPVSESAAGAAQSAIAPEDTGAIGSVRAGLSALASGATLGATDWILKGVQTEGQTEQLAAERAANPVISGLGQAAGMILPAIVTGGAATPSGYLSKLAMEGVEAGRAAGGAAGVAQALGAAGAEGAIQNAGIYLSDVALGDRQLTAEGVTGALGTGFAFGAGGLAAMHGIEAGTIAARRMFARYAEGGERAAQDAAHQWSTQSAAQLEAFDQTAEMARARLAQAEAARAQAGLAREQAAAGLAEARVPVAPEAMPPMPDLPPDARVALLLRERAHQMTPEAKAAWDAKFGPDLQKAIEQNPTARKIFVSPPGAGGEAIAPAELDQAMRVHGTGPAGEPTPGPLGGAGDAAGVEPPGSVSVPFMVTRQMKAELSALGHSAEEIANMTPAQAWETLSARAATVGSNADLALAQSVEALPGTVGSFEDLQKLARDLEEYDTARRAFNEIQSRVDPDLEAALHGMGAPDVQSLPVPLGEFGAPGQRAFKSQEELARLAAGTPAEPAAAAQATGAARPQALRGQSLGEIAAEQAPIEVGKPRLQQGLPSRARATPEGPTPDTRGMYASARNLGERSSPSAAARELSGPDGIPEYGALGRHLDASGKDYLEATIPARSISDRGYYEMPGAHADKIRTENARKIIAEGQREPIVLTVSPKGNIVVDYGRHRLRAAIEADAPIRVKWTTGFEPAPTDVLHAGRAAAPGGAGDDLLAALRGTADEIGAGRALGEIGATSPARAEYVAAKEARTTAAAEHLRGKANAENYAGSEMAAVERAAQPPAGPDATAVFKLEDAGLRFDPKSRTYHPVGGERLTPPPVAEMHVGLLPRAEPSEALTAVRARPAAVRQLEAAQDAALERAATATDPAVRTAAKREAAAIEEQLTRLEKRPGIVEDISAMAEAATRVEKAAAAITESVGDAAPAAAKEHAKAFRAAEEAADHKMTSRIARAADDHAAGGADLVNGPSAGEQRIAAAKRAKLEADAAFARAKAVETEARMGADAAAKQAADLRATMPDVAAPSARPSGGMARKVAEGARTVGVAAELASDFGIPGVPRPHDIPVIGPLLSVYLKYRALRAAAGRFVGRVPATAETRAAALAARTKDTMARAVDRSMGLIERNPASVRVAATATGLAVTAALSRRALDDGEPDAPKGATVQQQAAVRIREVVAAATNPQLIADKVRAETRGILDPDLIDAMENHLMAMYKHLADVAPKLPPPNPYTKTQPVPSTAAAMRFGRQLAVANNPNVAFEALHTRTLTPDMAETLRVCYAKLFAMAQRRLVERAADLKHPVEYRQLMQNAVLFDVPLHASLHPENIAVLATAHAPPPQEQAPAGPAGGPPTPSIANPTNTSQIYQTTADRRAQQR